MTCLGHAFESCIIKIVSTRLVGIFKYILHQLACGLGANILIFKLCVGLLTVNFCVKHFPMSA